MAAGVESIAGEVIRGLDREEIEKIKETYAKALPYQHCIIKNFCHEERLQKVREEIIENFTATYKETDLFKMLQTVDLANLDGMEEEKKGKIPNLIALRDDIYSEEFRRLVSDITGCGDLSSVTDCACNIHPIGGHLLCHDDVIGDRKVSYIIYLTDPESEWKKEDGGALEMYPEDPDAGKVPHTVPTATALPLWNTMAMFEVQAGKSFHSIQEVMTAEKPRMSIQGWFHGTANSEIKGTDDAIPTLGMLQQSMLEEDLKKFSKFKEVVSDQEEQIDDDDYTLSEMDVEYLSKWINPIYLTGSTMPKIQHKFEEDGSIQLLNFLKDNVANEIRQLMIEADKSDKLGNGKMPEYMSGVEPPYWLLQGPCHMQRYLKFGVDKDVGTSSDPKKALGKILQSIYDDLFSSAPFGNLVRCFTTLTMLGCHGEVRRFRPGLDYTVAHYGGLTKDPRMDAVLCFVDELSNDWADGESGGFEAYLLADDDEGVPAEVYRQVQDDDSGVLNVSPTFNSLNLVLRDEGLMRFVKYVSSSAPGSRWDISAVLLPEDDSDNEE